MEKKTVRGYVYSLTKKDYVNIGCLFYMCCVKVYTSQDISAGRKMGGIGDGGESNGEYVGILAMKSGRLYLHFRQKGKYVNIGYLHF